MQPGQERMGYAPVLSHCSWYQIPDLPVFWSIVVKERPNIGTLFFGTFQSDRIPKTTKDVTVHFFIHSRISVNYTSEFREMFEAITYKYL